MFRGWGGDFIPLRENSGNLILFMIFDLSDNTEAKAARNISINLPTFPPFFSQVWHVLDTVQWLNLFPVFSPGGTCPSPAGAGFRDRHRHRHHTENAGLCRSSFLKKTFWYLFTYMEQKNDHMLLPRFFLMFYWDRAWSVTLARSLDTARSVDPTPFCGSRGLVYPRFRARFSV